MKSKLTKLLVALVCVTLCLAALCAVALADGTVCEHTAKIERPTGKTYPATCIAPGGYIYEVVCESCNAFLNEYRQSDASQFPVSSSAHNYTTKQVTGECAGATTTQQICTLCGNTVTDTNSGGHKWESKSHTASTCNDSTYTYEECSQCGMTRNYNTTATVAHTYTTKQPVVVRTPTCSVPGENTQECDCGQKTRTIPVATTPHSYNPTVTTQGNCTTKTKTSQTCSVCNYENVISYGDYVHSYETVVTQEADCTTAGTRVSRCSKCQREEWSVPIPALGHTTYWTGDESGHWKVCSRCGATTTGVQSHTPTRANDYCTTKATCSTCGYVVTPAGKHAASVATDSGDDTYHDLKCANCSYVSSRVKHTYTAQSGNCTSGRVCTVCGHRASGNSSHSLSSTWTGAGASQHSRKCTFSGCTYVQTEDHTWSDWTVTKEPTTTSVGTESRSCTKCSSSMVHAIPKLTAATDTPNASATSTPSSAATPTPAPTDAPTSSNTANAPARTQAPAATNAGSNANTSSNAGSSANTGANGNTNTNTNSNSSTSTGSNTGSNASTSRATAAPTTATNSPASATTAPTAVGTSASATAAPATNNASTATPALNDASSAPADAPEAAPADEAVVETADDPEAPLQDEPVADTACATGGTTCTETEFIQGGLLIRVCAVCGNVTVEALFDDGEAITPVFADVAGVTVTGAVQDGQLILRGANLYNETAGATDAFLALTASWEHEGLAQPFEAPVQVSLPLSIGDTADEGVLSVPTDAFKLVRIDIEEGEGYTQVQNELDYVYENGILSFEMDRVAIYLLIPA